LGYFVALAFSIVSRVFCWCAGCLWCCGTSHEIVHPWNC